MPLDRRDLGAIGLDREHRARLDGVAVEVDGAGAAVRRVAADVGAGQPEVVAQSVDEQQAGLDLEVVLDAVDVQAHVHRAAHSLSLLCFGQRSGGHYST